ncbi:unnamed protein product, partial [Rotaria sp. Silwood1]
DHQTTPMMNGDHHSDKTNGFTNSHSSSTKYKKSISTSRQLFTDHDSVLRQAICRQTIDLL